MNTWRPASHEPDPLLEAVNNAARATILPVAAINVPPPSSDGIRDLQLPDGRQLRIALTAHQMAQETHGVRAVVIYDIGGNALIDRIGYRVTGRAVVDIATRAFLDINCRLETVGSVDRDIRSS